MCNTSCIIPRLGAAYIGEVRMRTERPLRDYYKILDVARSASDEEIRASYRRLAKKFHPDVAKSEDSVLWMQLINEAYGVLGDPRKKALYDYVFFADNRFSSQDESEDINELNRIGTHRTGGFRTIFSNLIVSLIGLHESLDIIFMALVFLVAGLFVFDQFELAAGMMALLFVLASIYLVIRIIVEIFSWVGIRKEEAWFNDAYTSVSYLLKRTSDMRTDANKDL